MMTTTNESLHYYCCFSSAAAPVHASALHSHVSALHVLEMPKSTVAANVPETNFLSTERDTTGVLCTYHRRGNICMAISELFPASRFSITSRRHEHVVQNASLDFILLQQCLHLGIQSGR